MKQYRSWKCKHAPCHGLNYFESGTQAIDMFFVSHTAKYLQYYKVQQSQKTHRNNIRLSRFAGTTYAKSLGKICYIQWQGYTTEGPRAKCGPPEVWKWHASDLLNAVNAFQGKLKHFQQQLSIDMMQFRSMSSFINKTQTDLVPDFEKYVKCVKPFVKTFQIAFEILMARRRNWICFKNHSVWT